MSAFSELCMGKNEMRSFRHSVRLTKSSIAKANGTALASSLTLLPAYIGGSQFSSYLTKVSSDLPAFVSAVNTPLSYGFVAVAALYTAFHVAKAAIARSRLKQIVNTHKKTIECYRKDRDRAIRQQKGHLILD